MTKDGEELIKRFEQSDKSDDDWIKLDKDIREYVKNNPDDEDLYLFSPLGYGEMSGMIVDSILRKRKNE